MDDPGTYFYNVILRKPMVYEADKTIELLKGVLKLNFDPEDLYTFLRLYKLQYLDPSVNTNADKLIHDFINHDYRSNLEFKLRINVLESDISRYLNSISKGFQILRNLVYLKVRIDEVEQYFELFGISRIKLDKKIVQAIYNFVLSGPLEIVAEHNGLITSIMRNLNSIEYIPILAKRMIDYILQIGSDMSKLYTLIKQCKIDDIIKKANKDYRRFYRDFLDVTLTFRNLPINGTMPVETLYTVMYVNYYADVVTGRSDLPSVDERIARNIAQLTAKFRSGLQDDPRNGVLNRIREAVITDMWNLYSRKGEDHRMYTIPFNHENFITLIRPSGEYRIVQYT